jgi:riboflavin biosynthesis pyrimidine reductase
VTEAASIDALLPIPRTALDDDALAAHYSDGVSSIWLRANFVESVDGAATHNGLSGGLGDAADRRVFDILRRLCDVVLVGAGTVRAEGYGALRVDEASVNWRVAHGLTPQPTFAIVSGTLDLDPASAVFTEAPVRPLVLTVETSPLAVRTALAEVADIVIVGKETLDAGPAIAELTRRGLGRILCEGVPSLFGSLLAADLVDELCVTLSPMLEAGDARRIARGQLSNRVDLAVAGVLAAGSTLLLRYVRAR